MWAYIKISYAELNGTTDRTPWMNHLLMQSMVKAQCVSKENEPGVSKCICVSLICAVREKHLLMKGICLPLDPTGKWGEKMRIEAFEELGVKSNMANMEPERHPAPRSSHLSSCRSGVFIGINIQLLPRLCLGWGWRRTNVSSPPIPQPHLAFLLHSSGVLVCWAFEHHQAVPATALKHSSQG